MAQENQDLVLTGCDQVEIAIMIEICRCDVSNKSVTKGYTTAVRGNFCSESTSVVDSV